jgi:hypothetical protein
MEEDEARMTLHSSSSSLPTYADAPNSLASASNDDAQPLSAGVLCPKLR